MHSELHNHRWQDPTNKTDSAKEFEKQRRSANNRISRSQHAIEVYQTHQEYAFNTTNSNTTTNQTALEELNDKLEDAVTSSASTTQNEQPQR